MFSSFRKQGMLTDSKIKKKKGLQSVMFQASAAQVVQYEVYAIDKKSDGLILAS
jgi:hypothetical protein